MEHRGGGKMFDIYDFFNQLTELGAKIRLDVGQPDIPVDERIISALIESIKKGKQLMFQPEE